MLLLYNSIYKSSKTGQKKKWNLGGQVSLTTGKKKMIVIEKENTGDFWDAGSILVLYLWWSWSIYFCDDWLAVYLYSVLSHMYYISVLKMTWNAIFSMLYKQPRKQHIAQILYCGYVDVSCSGVKSHVLEHNLCCTFSN